MKKADFETVNKKHSRITSSIGYHWLCRFWNFQLPVWACRVTARACRFGFNRNDLFFLKYFRSRDEHYKNDLRPVFETWNQLMIQELGYHNVFNELHIDMADRLEGVDPEHIARDHLNAYGYQRDQTFEGIKHFIDAYNRRVTHFIEYFNETIKKGITQYTPTLKEYSTQSIILQIYKTMSGVIFGERTYYS